MLAPESRVLLTDALQPPAGWQVDLAFATTYSLDLTALLLAPMSFALHETSQDDLDAIDPIALLESLRRYADRTTVLCQAGGIHLPQEFSPLLQFLEATVCPVAVPTPKRIFHPKVWVLRFRSLEGSVSHRVLVLSRNLTFDRSWDTILRLDEDDEAPTFAGVTPLVDFILACVDMTTMPLASDRTAQVKDLANTLRHARLAPPSGFSDLRFVPFGVGTEGWSFPTDQADRALLISPFLDAGAVRAAVRASRQTKFLSRPESFDRVGPDQFGGQHSSWTFQRPAEVEVGDDPDPSRRASSEWSRVRDGLHAKTFILEHGRVASVLTGSANLTTAALNGNVELSVELTGSAAQCGIDAVWDGTPDAPGLSKLTEQYTPNDQSEADAARTSLEMDIDAFHRELAAATLTTEIVADDDGTVEGRLTLPAIPTPGDTMIWPISLDAIRARPYSSEASLRWSEQARRNITPFFAVETILKRGDVSATVTAVIKTGLGGDVGNRRLQTMTEILKNSNNVLRYLSFLLADPRLDASLGALLGASERRGFNGPQSTHDLVLLEPLMRATLGDGTALSRVASLVAEIESMPDNTHLLPDGFAAIWQAIRATSEVDRG